MAQTTVLHLPGSFSVRVPAVEHRQHILWHTKVSVCLKFVFPFFGDVSFSSGKHAFCFCYHNDDVTMTPCRHFVMCIMLHLPYY